LFFPAFGQFSWTQHSFDRNAKSMSSYWIA
jgi:hypothetical protein